MTNVMDQDITDIVKDAFLRTIDDGMVPTSVELNNEFFDVFKGRYPSVDTLLGAGWVLSIDTPRGKLPVSLNETPDAPPCIVVSENK
tara:strand:- start:907 stop:1167 length:261 start_codon:yes stop_codon:yes gene_type:complete